VRGRDRRNFASYKVSKFSLICQMVPLKCVISLSLASDAAFTRLIWPLVVL